MSTHETKQQVVCIHGAAAFSDHTDYLEHLQTRELMPETEESPRRWRCALREELGEAYEVHLPKMPNSDNAQYEEWKIHFSRYADAFLHDGAIVVGHSQGGYFLARYISEGALSFVPSALILVAAPFGPDDFGGEDGGDFAFDPEKFKRACERIPHIFIFHSRDDFVVPYSHAERYAGLLPRAELVTYEEEGHFLNETLPGLAERIKKVSENNSM